MDRRQREEQERRREEASQWAKENVSTGYQPGDPSRGMKSIEELSPGSKVTLYGRVSTENQERLGKLESQLWFLRYKAELGKLEIVDTVTYVGIGTNSEWLDKGFETTAASQANPLFESPDRVVRASEYSKYYQSATATDEELDVVISKADRHELQIYTCLPPLATYEEVRSHQSARGRKRKRILKNRKKGKPKGHREWFKERWLGRIMELTNQNYDSRSIATIVSYESEWDISHTSICNWTRHYGSNSKTPENNANFFCFR